MTKKKLVLAALLLWTGTAGALWVSPTSFDDPDGKWASETSAYDVNLVTYAVQSGLASGQPEHWLVLIHTGVSDCNKIKIHIGNSAGAFYGEIQVEYGGNWYSVLNGTIPLGWNIVSIGDPQTVTGIQIKTNTGTPSGSMRISEAFFWQPSTAPPTKVTNILPANEATSQEIKVILYWSGGSLLDTDDYKIYLGTDNPPTSIINGTIQNISNLPANESFNPAGLPPATTYYWRIDTYNDYDVNAGDIWSFTVRAAYKQFLD